MARVDAVSGKSPSPSPWWIECSETVGIDQVLALAAPSARHLVQLAPGRLRLRLFRLAGPGFEADGGWTNLPLRSVGTTPANGSSTVTLILEAASACTMHGHQVAAGEAVVWPADLEYDAIAPGGYRWVTVILPDAVADTLGGIASEQARRNGNGLRIGPLPRSLRTELRSLLHAVGAWRKPAIVDLDPNACRPLRYRWYDLVEHVFRRVRPAPDPPRALATASRVVRDVEAHWLADLGRRQRLPEACAAAGVSARTVESAFQRILGVPPSRYLQLLRAHALFLELRRRDDGAPASVQEAEARCGVLHPSRFASRYHAIFGERPSTTLQTARSAPEP